MGQKACKGVPYQSVMDPVHQPPVAPQSVNWDWSNLHELSPGLAQAAILEAELPSQRASIRTTQLVVSPLVLGNVNPLCWVETAVTNG